tara:strand:- start:165 stop:509 length:345 start_codon:yes stop_codon:yes gene_type:complete
MDGVPIYLSVTIGRRVGTNLQNAYMYLNSIWCNLAFLVLNGTLQEAVHPDNLRAVFSPTVLAIVAIMASVGMVTGLLPPTLTLAPTPALALILTPTPTLTLTVTPPPTRSRASS